MNSVTKKIKGTLLLTLFFILASCSNDSEKISVRSNASENKSIEENFVMSPELRSPAHSRGKRKRRSYRKKHRSHNSCTESSSNLISNGSFEMPQINKSWKILNINDDASLAWEVEWKNKRPCGKNVVAPRLEFQKYSGGQLVELDSDCQGNGQFVLNHPISQERVKTKIKQKFMARAGTFYKTVFKLKKRNNGVTEHIKVSLGKKRTIIKNKDITTNFVTHEVIKKLRSKDIDSDGYAYVNFDPIGGKSDSYGLMLEDVSVHEMNNCPRPTRVCKHPKSVVSYNPVGNVHPTRTDISKSLGAPNGEPYVANNVQFTSLGRGGEIVFKFSPRIKNVAGSDLRVYETSGGNLTYNQYKEEADVYGSNNLKKWFYLGKVKNDNNAPELGEIDLGSMNKAKYIKLVDTTSFSSSDGFDVDSLECINQEIVEVEHEANVYYSDKTNSKIYSVEVTDSKVKLTETLDSQSQDGGAHIALTSSKNYVYEIQGSSPNTLFSHNLQNKSVETLFDTEILDSYGLAFSSSDTLYGISAKTDEVYKINPDIPRKTNLGDIYLFNIKIDIIGGDLAFTDKNMYVVTQQGGGTLYEVFSLNGALEGREVISGLGKVSGLAVLDYDDYLVSVLESEYMLRIKDGVITKLKLEGDLLRQGTGGDLASQALQGESDF